MTSRRALLLVLASLSVTGPARSDPPFGGTIFIDPDIIRPDDATLFESLEATGRGVRTMYDRRSGWVTLDAYHGTAPDWIAAQQADPEFISTYARDNPTREDVAETFLTWLAVRHRADRISSQLAQTITAAVPNRLAYFDGLGLDLRPITSSGLGLHRFRKGSGPGFNLESAFPNPTAGHVSVAYSVDNARAVSVSVHDSVGRSVAVLERRLAVPGRNVVAWDGKDGAGLDLAPGVYFIRIALADRVSTRPVVLIDS